MSGEFIAPPDQVWIVVMDGFGGGMWYDSPRIVPTAAHLQTHEYVLLNGPTIQAAIAALEAALSDADDALTEAEAILGGEYGDHYATLCETMLKLRGRIAALGAGQ